MAHQRLSFFFLLYKQAIENLEFGVMGSQPHVLVVPYPAQGHVAPLMKFSHQIVDHGMTVTFVSPEFIHERLTTTMPMKSSIRLVPFLDGLEPGDDRNDTIKLTNSFLEAMPGHFKDLIEKINKFADERISCVITDGMVVPALEVTEKMGIKRVVLWPIGPTTLAIILSIPKLLQDGIIDTQGNN